MKKLTVIILFFVFCAQSASAMNKDEIVKYFQGNQESTAKDAIWAAPDIFKVGIFDDGSSRNGYAQYVCSILAENGLSRGTWVQIIDVIKLSKDKKWVKLGEAHCR